MAKLWSENITNAPGEGKLFLPDKMECSPCVKGAVWLDLTEQVLWSLCSQQL